MLIVIYKVWLHQNQKCLAMYLKNDELFTFKHSQNMFLVFQLSCDNHTALDGRDSGQAIPQQDIEGISIGDATITTFTIHMIDPSWLAYGVAYLASCISIVTSFYSTLNFWGFWGLKFSVFTGHKNLKTEETSSYFPYSTDFLKITTNR